MRTNRFTSLLFVSTIITLTLAVALTGTGAAPTASVAVDSTIRVSITSDGTEGNGWSMLPSISADGRLVAYESNSDNLVVGDTNGTQDVFVHDRLTGETMRVSVASDGSEGDDWSESPSISPDGRYVSFRSFAKNLVPVDTNDAWDIFVHDLTTGETMRVSVASDGSEGNGESYAPSISADGRYVAFHSSASNLALGDSNAATDVFVHDRVTGDTVRVSVASNGPQANDDSFAPSLAGGGRYVAFTSSASNLVADDTNERSDVFVHDRLTAETTRVSVANDGAQGNDNSWDPCMSADGRYVAFGSEASNLVSDDTNGVHDVFVHDRVTGETTRVSVASDGTQGNSNSITPSISGDGRYIALSSSASNFVPDDTNEIEDIYVRDRINGETTRVSVASDGTQGNGGSYGPNIAGDGRYVAFGSLASNLVPGDTNESGDVFVHDRYYGYLKSYLPMIAKP